MTASKDSTIQVFISYSHKDKEWLDRLNVHLAPIKRTHSMIIWDDTTIQPGMKWDDEIKAALSSIKVAVLLISADFLASEYIYNEELPVILDAASKKGATILSVIISPSMYSRVPGLSDIQLVNDPKEPLVNMSKGKKEELFLKVAEQIADILNKPSIKTIADFETSNAVPISNKQNILGNIKTQIQLFVDNNKDDRFLIVSVGDLYVQFAYYQDSFEIAMETASNQFLADEAKLTQDQINELFLLGFQAPDQNPNYNLDYILDDSKNVSKLAELTYDVLFKIHQVSPNSGVSFEQGDF